MNKKNHFFIFLFALILSLSLKVSAQAKSDWQPIYLMVTGGNIMDGVEASFQLNTCNGEDVVYLKFINHSSNPVKLEWTDAVFTHELKWINKDEAKDKKSLQIPAKAEVKGNCSNNVDPELFVKLKDFVIDKKDFKRYSASHLKVIAVQ